MYEKNLDMHNYAKNIAPFIMELKTSFMEAGFTEQEAFELAKAFYVHTLENM